MSLETLILDRDDNGVVVVTLNRPPVNAVNLTMQRELRTTFTELSSDRSVRAVVLAASGDRAFCGGIDLKDISNPSEPESIATVTNPGWEWRAAQRAIRHCSVPVISAVERPAIGAGFGLVGVSDLIIASTTARFGLTEINVGLLGGASKALRLVGPHKARMMMFTGRLQDAEELYRLGAIEQVVASGEALETARGIAAEIATKSPLAMRLAKESIVRIETDESEDQYRIEWDYTNRLRAFNDSREAMSAYLEKREPSWTLT